ncbi:pr151 [rat cytomegalovirus strain Maastricht]|uniref:Pr151 n=1 Tax=Rat cytomegalovirus (strain Maastricht) TaxID=79700 RepID=Q9DW45_RCMVM|nr:pr151 [rat cytomegalovirus strain Maastricht]AAF99245.1 pr151 [rat cytomegalovirus strain Maastricht]WEG72065.1 membrane protein r151 [Murid betaherpesvirus 2]
MKMLAEHVFRRNDIFRTIFMYVTIITAVGGSFVDTRSSVTNEMCEPPVLVFYSMTVGGTDIVLSVGGLNETSPLFGIYPDGNPWTTKWINLTKEDPEINFLLDQDQHINLMQAYFGHVPDLVGLRYECPLTKDNFTCIIKFMLNSDIVELSESTPAPSESMELIEGVSKWLNINILKNNSDILLDRWGLVCTGIANISDPNHMSIMTQVGNGWTTCTGTTPSPTRFWLSVNESNSVVEINSTYTRSNETGWATLNVSTNPGDSPSCSAKSILGWTVVANQTQLEGVYELPKLAKQIGGLDSETRKDCTNGQSYDFLIVLMIVVFLILAVVYLFFKNQIHVWMVENVLSRFGVENKESTTSSVNRSEFRPMI